MKFGALIIGDEILSGRRQDKHLAKVIELLSARGLRLHWVRYCGDDPKQIAAILTETFASGDTVFSFGGIGATPDDRTRESAAAALGCPLALHPEAEAEIHAQFGDQVTPARLRLGEFPENSDIIPNPVNRVPGFSIRDHYFVPGFPVMAWSMIEWVLDHHYAHLFHQDDYAEYAVTVWDTFEGQLIPLMEQLTRDYPDCALFSLPTIPAEGERRSLELGMKGPKNRAAEAMKIIERELDARGMEWVVRE